MATKKGRESPPQVYVTGFGSLASFIASDDDHKPAVYKRFDKLATRDLLYYQSELSHLQTLQDEYDIQDSMEVEKTGADSADHHKLIRECSESWYAFEQAACGSASPGQSGPGMVGVQANRWKQKMELAMRIRRTLKEYREALLQESTLLALQPPSQQTMTAMSKYFHSPGQGPQMPDCGEKSTTVPILSGESASLYPLGMKASHIRASDYVSLAAPDEPDRLTGLLRSSWFSRLFRSRRPSLLPQYQTEATSTRITHYSPPEIRHYAYRRVKLTASLITTLTAATLLFLPIYILYHTSSTQPNVTMGLIAMFTVVFALALAMMTTASRSEIFGACAAYAAVLVVFVSGDFASGVG